MQQNTIQRLALGNPLKLGYLYNACNDQPSNMCILTQYPPPTGCVNLTETKKTFSDFVHETSMSDKLSKLDLAAELKLSLCAGLINVTGSGEYLKEYKDSERIVSVSLVNKVTTVYEDMNILDKRLEQVISLDALKHPGATHVVTGVTWGGSLVITIKFENSEGKDEQKIVGNLQAELKQFGGSGKLKYGDGNNREETTFKLKIVGDVNIDGPFPTTLKDSLELLQKLPALVRQSNGGKGVPIKYDMISLEAIQSYFGFNVKIDCMLRAIEEDIILRMVTMFDAINAAKQKLNDLWTDVREHQDYLPEDMVSAVRHLRDETDVAESQFKAKLSTLLIQVRSSKAETCALDALRKEFHSSPYSPHNVLKRLRNDFRAVRAKMELLSTIRRINVVLVPSYTESLINKLLGLKGKQVYVLFGESKAIRENPAEWIKHLNTFSKLMDGPKASETFKFMYVDLDASKHLQPATEDAKPRKVLLQLFDEHGICKDRDVLDSKNHKDTPTEISAESPPLQWIPANSGEVPKNAVVGGYDGNQELYVARARHQGNLIPGKLQKSHGGCYVPYGRSEHREEDYEVLVARPGTMLQWVRSGNGELVKDAVVGGHDLRTGELYYIGRRRHNGALIPGKVQLSERMCYIPYHCKELNYNTYEILVSK